MSAGPAPAAGVARGEAEILAPLNDEQRAAVTHGAGPLLIVAGAGTGKTQVVTRRIAWLIATKRARPEAILALTFTDKAAAEMEARVDELVPYGYVGATISTFHAFCDRLVREHAIELGLTSQLRVDTPAEMLVFLREHVFDLGLERYLPLGRPDQHLKALLSVFDRARDEDVTPEDYLAFADGLRDAAGGDPARLDRARAELEKASVYAAFQALVLEHGRVDFGAQIALALRLLRERAWILRAMQERFRHILVDEFQDTNHVQFELIRLLAGRNLNVTVVGDDDQSIYRFRGAKVENLLAFRDAFPGAETIVLRRNYRSRQRILDVSHRLIRHNDPERLEAKLGFDKRLLAHRDGEGVVEHLPARTASDEADTVARAIEELLRGGERRAGDVAILARAHASLDPFASALRARGVPFRRVGMRGLYGRPEVQLCLHALRALADPDDDTSAHLLIADPFFGADGGDLARLGAAARKRNRRVLALAREAANDPESGIAEATREAYRRVLVLYDDLKGRAARRPTAEILYAFADESGLLRSLAAEESVEAIERVQNVGKLFAIVQRVGPLLRSDRVQHFVHHLDLLMDMGDDPAAAEVDVDENAVHLLTVHNAKGLEFDVVFMVHLVEGRFPAYPRGDVLPFPPELRKGVADAGDDHYREERRLFYVGLTRARDRAVLCHATDYGGVRAHKPSRFIMEALDIPAPARGARGATALEAIARHAPVPTPDAAPAAPLPADAPIRVSHHQIDDVLTCPLKYRYAHVVNVPIARDPRAMFGIAVHHALRVYHQHRILGHPIDADDVVRVFEEAWSSEGFYSREHEERRLEEGRAMLRRFVARSGAGPQPLAVEREFKFRRGPTTVVGRWDRIDERAEGIVLVDYKTSDLDDREKAAERAERDARDGQLGLYALAYREMHGVVPAAVELAFVASGIAGTAKVQASHLERAEDRIERAAATIRSGAFPPRPDQRSCGFCPYSRFCPHSVARGPV